MGSKNKAPPPVDYAAAAQQQGAENRATSLSDWLRSNVNQVTPYGTRALTADPSSASGYTETTALNPEDQAQLDRTRALQAQLLGVGSSTMQQVQDALGKPINTAGLPALTGSVNAGKMSTIDPNTGNAVQTGIDTSGLQSLTDPTAVRQQMIDSAYKNFSDRFDPLAARQQEEMRTRQAAMGGVTTSQGATQQMADLLRSQNDARSQAIFDSQKAGQDAAAQIEQQQLANRGQTFGERATEMSAANQAQQQLLSNALSSTGFNNSATQQDTQNAMANAALGNSARAQGLNEQQSIRQMSLNELMAMLSGTQVNAPTFQGVAGSQTNAAPIFGAAQATGAQNQATNAANAASQNSMMSGIGGMAGMAAMFL